MSEKITINYATAIILNKVCDQILYETLPDNTKKERVIPFRLKYRISKGLSYISKDIYNFEKWKLQLLATYGDPTEDGTNVVLSDPEKKKLFINSLNKILATEVTHSISKLEPEDLEQLDFKVDETSISYSAMKLFQAYFCNEPDLLKELNTEINFDFGDLLENQEIKLQNENITEKVSDNNKENETSDSEVKESRKTTRKKTSSKASTTTKKTAKKSSK